MPYDIYDYIDADGVNEFAEWTKSLEKFDRAKLNTKLDMLMLHGEGMRPQVLTGTSVAGIQKLRVQGNVQLRPMLCNGPCHPKIEYTLLLGAKEVGDKLVPKTAPSDADAKKSVVAETNGKRRIKHERVS